MEASTIKLGYEPVMDAEFAANMEEIVQNRKPRDMSSWDWFSFAEKIFSDLVVHPVTLEFAQFASRIEDEQAAPGNVIAFQDLIIGTTALQLGFEGRHDQSPPLRTHPRPPGCHS